MSVDVAIVDGLVTPLADGRIPVTDPAITVGWSVFETLRGEPGGIVELEAHLDRLARSAAACCIAMPDRTVLVEEIVRAASHVGGVSRIRVTLTGGGRRIVAAHALDTGRLNQGVRCARGPHVDSPYLDGEVKHGSRAEWVVAVQRACVDEVLLVDRVGRFTEGTTSAILAVIDGALWTAAHDGRILQSTTCNQVLERAARAGIAVRREGPPASGPWEGLYIASTTRDLAPVVELDGVALPGWEPVGRRLSGE